jgi:hypothetical protein
MNGQKVSLSPTTICVGHNWCDHIHQLSQAGDLDPVRIPKQSNEHSPNEQRIFKIIDILKKV